MSCSHCLTAVLWVRVPLTACNDFGWLVTVSRSGGASALAVPLCPSTDTAQDTHLEVFRQANQVLPLQKQCPRSRSCRTPGMQQVVQKAGRASKCISMSCTWSALQQIAQRNHSKPLDCPLACLATPPSHHQQIGSVSDTAVKHSHSLSQPSHAQPSGATNASGTVTSCLTLSTQQINWVNRCPTQHAAPPHGRKTTTCSVGEEAGAPSRCSSPQLHLPSASLACVMPRGKAVLVHARARDSPDLTLHRLLLH